MQRAAAKDGRSNSNSPISGPSFKRQRLSTGGFSPITPSTETLETPLSAVDRRREEALERQAAAAGETKWYLDVPESEFAPSAQGLRVSYVGFADIDADTDEEEGAVEGRLAFGDAAQVQVCHLVSVEVCVEPADGTQSSSAPLPAGSDEATASSATFDSTSESDSAESEEGEDADASMIPLESSTSKKNRGEETGAPKRPAPEQLTIKLQPENDKATTMQTAKALPRYRQKPRYSGGLCKACGKGGHARASCPFYGKGSGRAGLEQELKQARLDRRHRLRSPGPR